MTELVVLGRGSFAIGPRPRGGSWLLSDLAALRRLGFGLVVSLLTDPEAEELFLTREAQSCDQLGLQYLSYPIPDRTVPADRGAFGRFADQVFERISHCGGQAYCHCQAGLGRAPLLGCALLVRAGMTTGDSWALLSEKRGHRVPETREQREWVRAREPGG